MKIGGLLLFLAIPACCILLTVVTAGTLAAIAGWFMDGPGLALAAAIGAGIIVYILWRWCGTRARRSCSVQRRQLFQSELNEPIIEQSEFPLGGLLTARPICQTGPDRIDRSLAGLLVE